jgi:hypothetical protein
MRHPVIAWFEVAEAENKTGEVSVALFAGVETLTLTHADANIGREITHRTISGFNRITRLLLKKTVRSGGDFPRSTAHQVEFVLLFRVLVRKETTNEGNNSVAEDFST